MADEFEVEGMDPAAPRTPAAPEPMVYVTTPRPGRLRRAGAGSWHVFSGLWFLVRRPALWPLAALPTLLAVVFIMGGLLLGAFSIRWLEGAILPSQGKLPVGLGLVLMFALLVLAISIFKPAAVPAPSRKPVLEGPKGLRIRYQTEVIPALVKQFEYANPNQVPKLEKIVVNVGLGEALSNAKAIDAASSDLTMITGQKPIVTKARRSIAQFKIRTGNPIGLKVTLRGQRMWDFLERLLLLTLPRIRDFRGTPSRSFDGRGNYSLGMREQIAFPEIDYDKVDRLRGLEVSIVTTAKSDEESKRLLELLGMPFAS